MSFDSLLDDSGPLLLVIGIGLFEGSFIGSMATIVPMQVTLLMAMLTSVLVWRSQRISFFAFTIMLGAVIGGGFGAIGNTVPWGFTIFFAVQLMVYVWRTGAVGGVSSNLTSLIAMPFYIFISVGLFYNSSYSDFCILNGADVCANVSSWVNGFPTIWAGCVNTCTITPLSFFGSSIFSTFINSAAKGDYVGMITSLFTGPQTGLGGIIQFITVIVSFTIGLILVLLGLGIGFNASVLASGFGIQINEAGTRFAQSFGITLIMWSIFYGGFGGWFSAFGTGLSWGGVFSTSLVVLFSTMVFYGGYVQGKEITHSG